MRTSTNSPRTDCACDYTYIIIVIRYLHGVRNNIIILYVALFSGALKERAFIFFVFFFSPYFPALLPGMVDPAVVARTRISTETAPERPLSRDFRKMTHFFPPVQCTLIIHRIVFPRYENGVRLRRRDSDSGPFGTIGVFFYGFFPSHSQFYIRRSPRPTATREYNPNATRTHTCTHTHEKYYCRRCSIIWRYMYMSCELCALDGGTYDRSLPTVYRTLVLLQWCIVK